MTELTEMQYRQLFKAELAKQLGCDIDSIPVAVTKDDAAKYLLLKNPKTLSVWKCKGSYGIKVFKVGRNTTICTTWMIELRVASAVDEKGAVRDKGAKSKAA